MQRGRPSPHGALRREQRRRGGGGGGLQQAQSAGPQIIGHSSAPLGITRQAVQPITTKNQRVKNQAQKKDEKTNGKNPEYWAKRGFLVWNTFQKKIAVSKTNEFLEFSAVFYGDFIDVSLVIT